jgi:ribose-phosphate pyrophosphokinase
LLFFAGALKDAGARSVTTLLPYLAYSRKDRRTKSRDPVTTRYLATMLQSIGIDRVVTVDVHNPTALDNSFRCPTVNLSTTRLFADYFHRTIGDSVDSVLAPDLGGVKATRLFIDAYAELSGSSLPLAVMDKRRSEGKVSGSGLIGTIGEHVLIVDDMIGSGTTLCRATKACIDAGATRVSVGATHGLFQEGAPRLFAQAGIDSITVTDTVALDRLSLPAQHLARVSTIGTAAMLADCLRQIIP